MKRPPKTPRQLAEALLRKEIEPSEVPEKWWTFLASGTFLEELAVRRAREIAMEIQRQMKGEKP